MENDQLEIFKNLIEEFNPADKKEEGDKHRLLSFFEENGLNSFSNENYKDGHVTGSAFIYDPKEQKILLLHHKKLNRWLQPGGHSDGNPDIVSTAEREILEETGVKEFTTDSKIFDIDIHKIPAKEGKHPEHFHYDVRFLFLTDSNIQLIFNDKETNDLKWIELSKLFEYVNKDDEAFKRVKNKLDNVKI